MVHDLWTQGRMSDLEGSEVVIPYHQWKAPFAVNPGSPEQCLHQGSRGKWPWLTGCSRTRRDDPREERWQTQRLALPWALGHVSCCHCHRIYRAVQCPSALQSAGRITCLSSTFGQPSGTGSFCSSWKWAPRNVYLLGRACFSQLVLPIQGWAKQVYSSEYMKQFILIIYLLSFALFIIVLNFLVPRHCLCLRETWMIKRRLWKFFWIIYN